MSFRFLDDEARGGPIGALFPLRRRRSLLFGGLTFEERWRLLLSGRAPGERGLVLVLNSLALPEASLIEAIARTRDERVFTAGEEPIAALVREETLSGEDAGLREATAGLPSTEADGEVAPEPWKMIEGNGERIARDLDLYHGLDENALELRGMATPLEPVDAPEGSAVSGEEGLYLGPECRIEPFVHFDTREGPIVLGARVVVESHATLRGPLWIRNDARVNGGARIGRGTTVGEGSRVAGEVEATIFGAFSNKQHEGFLGHASVGEWVNLGAGTDNSDLKNNYGTVRLGWGEGTVDTGLQKFGCFLGDHVKSAIGTRIGTGTVVGVAGNLFGPAGFVSGYVPPFTWGESGDVYDFDRAIDTMKVVRARRKAELERAGRPVGIPDRQLNILRELWERRTGSGS
ncbi:MAG: putative sugar nucleotidyl transferase [Candidatus Eisenbacteria bacterium]